LLTVLVVSTRRRAASKTNKTNTVARRVSMIGVRLGGGISQIVIIFGLEVDP
jgi:hypothetical protein